MAATYLSLNACGSSQILWLPRHRSEIARDGSGTLADVRNKLAAQLRTFAEAIDRARDGDGADCDAAAIANRRGAGHLTVDKLLHVRCPAPLAHSFELLAELLGIGDGAAREARQATIARQLVREVGVVGEEHLAHRGGVHRQGGGPPARARGV